MKLFLVLFVMFGLSAANEEQNLKCFFYMHESYTCAVEKANIPDSANLIFNISGKHKPDQTDNDVERILISYEKVPFIITKLFEQFPSVHELEIKNSGLKRVQKDAFEGALWLSDVKITNNAEFEEIQEKAFYEADNLMGLDLSNNNILKIDETAFHGLTRLIELNLSGNKLRVLQSNLFDTLKSLIYIDFGDNQLQTLSGFLFKDNPEIVKINIDRNQIKEIGEKLLDNLNSLEEFDANENVCVNKTWSIDENMTVAKVNDELSTCFKYDDSCF